MKNNLPANRQRSALTAIILSASLLSLVLTLGGCSSPSAVERFLFNTTTNYVPRVVMNTNTVGNELIVTVQTNLTPVIESAPSPEAQQWAAAASTIADMFAPGVGKLMLLASTGALGIYGVSRTRKLNDALSVANEHETDSLKYQRAAETLTQTIEVFREVLKQTPQGQALNTKMTDLMQRHQLTAGVIREVAQVVSATVDNDKAKRLADSILATIPAAS